MSEAVRKPGQGRDGAVQPQIHARNAEPGLSGIAWKPRADDRTARQVNDRATVFDRPRPDLKPADPIEAISDPIWRTHDAQGRTQWTPDLVHARMLLTGDVMKRMPGPLRRSYVSVLGNIALTEMGEPSHRIAPTPEEISIADWTLIEIMQRAHRGVLLASAFGISGDKIAETMKGKGLKISGSTVQGLYLGERRILAGQWQGRRLPVDQPSFERWEKLFPKRRN